MSQEQSFPTLLTAAHDPQVEGWAADFAARGLPAFDIDPDDLEQQERDFRSRHPQVDFDAAVMFRLFQASGTE